MFLVAGFVLMREPDSQPEQRQPWGSLVPIAGIIGSLSAILIVTTTSARASLDPLIFNIIFIVFSAAILALLLYYFVWRPISPTVKFRLREGKLESASRAVLPDFRDIVDKFVPLASSSYTIGIHRPIQSFQAFQPDASRSPEQLRTDSAQKHLMQTLSGNYHLIIDQPASHLQGDIALVLKRKDKKFMLAHFAPEFFNLLWMYKSFFVNSYVQACKSVGVQNVPQNSREEYAQFMTKFNQFVSSYSDFAKKANRALGERVFGEHLEDAVPLTA